MLASAFIDADMSITAVPQPQRFHEARRLNIQPPRLIRRWLPRRDLPYFALQKYGECRYDDASSLPRIYCGEARQVAIFAYRRATLPSQHEVHADITPTRSIVK